MPHAGTFRSLADLVLVTHVAFVAFIVVGWLLIMIGGGRGWGWIRDPWFRALHLTGIALVAVQGWLGMDCPLTMLEMGLRERAGDATYQKTFVAHWLQQWLYYDAPEWVFVAGYTLFGLAVAGSWWWFRPRPFQKRTPEP